MRIIKLKPKKKTNVKSYVYEKWKKKDLNISTKNIFIYLTIKKKNSIEIKMALFFMEYFNFGTDLVDSLWFKIKFGGTTKVTTILSQSLCHTKSPEIFYLPAQI